MTPRAALPLDRIIAVYNAILAAAWWSVAGHGGAAPYIAAAHTVAVALPWLLDRGAGRWSRPMRLLVESYPLLWIGAFFTELGPLQLLRRLPAQDAWVLTVDGAAFGTHPHLDWRPVMPAPWFAEVMFFCYFVYYLLIFVPPLVMLARRRHDAVRDILLRLVTTYLVCQLVYLVAPVYGPKFTPEVQALNWPEGFWARLVHDIHAAGDSPGTAFPSSHCAAVVTMAWFAWLWFRRRTALVMTLAAAAVVLSTIYTQNHYAIDALAGVGVAVILQSSLLPLLQRAFAAGPLTGVATLLPPLGNPGLGPEPPRGES